jgi:hypothetical protein
MATGTVKWFNATKGLCGHFVSAGGNIDPPGETPATARTR